MRAGGRTAQGARRSPGPCRSRRRSPSGSAAAATRGRGPPAASHTREKGRMHVNAQGNAISIMGASEGCAARIARLGIALCLRLRIWRRQLPEDLLEGLVVQVVGGPLGVFARRRLELLSATSKRRIRVMGEACMRRVRGDGRWRGRSRTRTSCAAPLWDHSWTLITPEPSTHEDPRRRRSPLSLIVTHYKFADQKWKVSGRRSPSRK